MKILLLNPLVIYEGWPIPSDFWRHKSRVIGITFPQLASVIENNECKIYDGFAEKDTLKDYLKVLSEYDVISISAVSAVTALNIELTVRLIKLISKDTKIILGGHHATAYPEEWIKKGADIIVKNEGEITFKEVINALENGSSLFDIKGIVFKDKDEVINNPERELVESLDNLPFPRWDLVNFNNYRLPFGNREISALIETSRGCSYSCTFCNASWMWRYRQRYKTVDRVIEEFKILYMNGVRNIAIADDNFGSNYERDIRILEELIGLDIKVNLWMFCRADIVLNHSDFISVASKAGLKQVIVGFESIEESKLKDYNKNLIDFKDAIGYRDIYKILKQNNIMVLGAFISDVSVNAKPTRGARIKYGEICDVAMHQELIPIKGIPEYDKLKRHHKLDLDIDPFYFDRFISPYKHNNLKKRMTNFIRSLHGIFNFNLIKIIFSLKKDDAENRGFILNIYRSILKCIFDISLDKIIIFLKCLTLFSSPSDKQNIVLKKYLNEDFLFHLIESNK